MIEKLTEVLRLAREKKYNDALDIIDEIEEVGPVPPGLLVQRGILMQLAENSAYTIQDVENAFVQALRVDEDYVEALNELGYLYYAVMDNAAKARSLFEHAFALCKSQMTESVTGLGNCIFELEGKEKALEFVHGVLSAPMDMEEIATLKEEIIAEGD